MVNIFSDSKFHGLSSFGDKAKSRFKFPASKDLIDRVIWQESRGKSDAVSPVGAFGLMQIMPETGHKPGFGIKPFDFNAADQDAENVRFGTEYLSAMLDRYNGDEERALVAYNWGPGNADKWDGRRSSLPAETRGYLENIVDKKARPPSGMDNRESPLMAEVPKDPVPVDKDPYSHIAPVEAQMTEEDLQGATQFGAQGRSIFDDPRYYGASAVAEPTPQPAAPVAPEPATPVVNETAIPGGATLENKMPLPEPDNSVSLGGSAKAVGSGLYEGALGLGGSIGDIREGFDWAGDKLGLPKQVTKRLNPMNAVDPFGMAPTGSELLDASENTFGKTYVPKNFLERSLKTGGQIAPALALGAGGLAKSALGTGAKVAKNAAMSGAAIEAAGDMAEKIDPALRPYAEMGAAFVTGGRAAMKKPPRENTFKSYEQFKNKADEAYDAVRDINVPPDTMKDLARQAMANLNAAKFDPDMKSSQAVKDWLTTLTKKLQKSDNTVQTLIDLKSSELTPIFRAGGRNSKFAYALKEAVEDTLDNAPQIAGRLKGADKAYAMQKKAEFLTKLEKSAGRRASQMSQGELENAVKTEARQLLRKMDKDTRNGKLLNSMFNDKEKKMLEDIANPKGGKAATLIKKVGKINPVTGAPVTAGGIIASLLSGQIWPIMATSAMQMAGGMAGRSLNKAAERRFDKFINQSLKGNPGRRSAGQLAQPVLRPFAIDEGN